MQYRPGNSRNTISREQKNAPDMQTNLSTFIFYDDHTGCADKSFYLRSRTKYQYYRPLWRISVFCLSAYHAKRDNVIYLGYLHLQYHNTHRDYILFMRHFIYLKHLYHTYRIMSTCTESYLSCTPIFTGKYLWGINTVMAWAIQCVKYLPTNH